LPVTATLHTTSLEPIPGTSLAKPTRAKRRPTIDAPIAGFTVEDVAIRERVGADKVRGWIARGELLAINVAATLCGKPRWVISPEALTEFENRRSSAPVPKPKRKQRPHGGVDYFP
jgi:hypothetical protein